MALPEVDGLGVPPLTAKMPSRFAEDIRARAAHAVVPVFLTLMTDDTDRRWLRELERLGAVVGAYDPDIRAYKANVRAGILETVAKADFILFIEPIGIVETSHDTAVPAMGADAVRTYEGSPGIFSGTVGANVPIAVMDTGLNVNHMDIASNRDSICGANMVQPDREQDQDLWVDARGHGTHVTGTIVGNGTAAPRYAGMAPGVRHIRFAKVLNSEGRGSSDQILAGMDFLSRATECSGGGRPEDRIKPLIVNMSLSSPSLTFEGRDHSARKLDAVVWGHKQLYVVSQANSSIYGFSNYGAAKNSLSVGAAMDSGELASFSSLGPTSDGRLAPQVVGTGVDLWSAEGGDSPDGYRLLSGTSMSSPSVAGVAALLMDAVPEHREQPALARARLMASAIKPDAWLNDPGAFPPDNSTGPGSMNARYGLGKVSAHASILERDQDDGWTSGSFTSILQDDEYSYHDIVVPEGASRLDVVLAWDEPPTDIFASSVLNDLDLWLDYGADCADVECGEYASESRKDNVEWVIVRDPRPGTWRLKVAAHRVYTGAPRAAVAWTVIRSAATPGLAITPDKDVLDDSDELTLTVSASGYVAAGTQLHFECRVPDGSAPCDPDASVDWGIENADGLETSGSMSSGNGIALGEIAAGESRDLRLDGLSYPNASRLHFTVTGWNAKGAV